MTTALVLARKGYRVTVVAQHMPGDLSIDYTSPWAVKTGLIQIVILGGKLAINSAFVGSFSQEPINCVGNEKRSMTRLRTVFSGISQQIVPRLACARWAVLNTIMLPYMSQDFFVRAKRKFGLKMSYMTYGSDFLPLSLTKVSGHPGKRTSSRNQDGDEFDDSLNKYADIPSVLAVSATRTWGNVYSRACFAYS